MQPCISCVHYCGRFNCSRLHCNTSRIHCAYGHNFWLGQMLWICTSLAMAYSDTIHTQIFHDSFNPSAGLHMFDPALANGAPAAVASLSCRTFLTCTACWILALLHHPGVARALHGRLYEHKARASRLRRAGACRSSSLVPGAADDCAAPGSSPCPSHDTFCVTRGHQYWKKGMLGFVA